MIPLFFQVVLLDTASKAGIRLIVPSLSTPIGGLIAGFVMSRWGMLGHLVRTGCVFMVLGNGLVASLKYQDSSWKYVAYLFPANIGQGIVYPSILFTNIAHFEQSQQAVSTSMVYLFRSMGTVWGVAAASTIIQNILSSRLPAALAEFPNSEKAYPQPLIIGFQLTRPRSSMRSDIRCLSFEIWTRRSRISRGGYISKH